MFTKLSRYSRAVSACFRAAAARMFVALAWTDISPRRALQFSSSSRNMTNGIGGNRPSSQTEKQNLYLTVGGLAAIGAGILYYVNREVSHLISRASLQALRNSLPPLLQDKLKK